MSAANADHFLIVYLRFETKEKIHLLLPLCYHFFGYASGEGRRAVVGCGR